MQLVLKFQMRLEALSRLSINRQQLGVAIGPVSDLLAFFDEKLRPIVEVVETLRSCNIKVDCQGRL